MSNLLAGWYYCAYEPCDVGARHTRLWTKRSARQTASTNNRPGDVRPRRSRAALDTLVQKLGVLEEHLERHAYCCGERMGVDDVMRFVVLQILFTNLGELWGMTAPAYARLPHVARWMGDMAAKDSNPFKYVHDSEMYYRAHRDWWVKKMPQRLFPKVEQEVSRLRLKPLPEPEA